MKNLAAFLIATCAMMACSKKMHVHPTNKNEQATASYRIYNWLDFKAIKGGIVPNAATYTNEFFYYYNELTDTYIREAVDAEMRSNNLHLGKDEASLQLRYHIVTDQRDSLNYTFSGKDTAMLHTINPNHPSATAGINGNEFSKGSLILEIVDIRSNILIWRGWTADAFNFNNNESTKESIRKAVKKIFVDFSLKVTAKN